MLIQSGFFYLRFLLFLPKMKGGGGPLGLCLRSATDYVKFKFLLVVFKGKRHAYSNLGYTVLGQVIERKTGQDYEEFMTGLLKSVGINQMKIGRTRKKDLGNEEVRADVLWSYSPRGEGFPYERGSMLVRNFELSP